MFGLEGILQIDNARAIEADHYVAFIGYNTLLSALEKPFLLHQFECIECSCTFQSNQKYSTEPSSTDALDDIEIFQLNAFVRFISPNRFDFK
jgi:hypothetical protein